MLFCSSRKKITPKNRMFCFVLKKLAFFLTFCVFGSCFRTLAVILVSDLLFFYVSKTVMVSRAKYWTVRVVLCRLSVEQWWCLMQGDVLDYVSIVLCRLSVEQWRYLMQGDVLDYVSIVLCRLSVEQWRCLMLNMRGLPPLTPWRPPTPCIT